MWRMMKLGDICDISIGKTPPRGEKRYWDKGKQTENVWLSIADLTSINDRYASDSKEYVSDEGASLFKTVPKDTLVMSFKLSIGKLAFTKRELRTNEAIAALPIKDESVVSKEFLYHYLSSLDWDVIAGNDVKVKGKTLNKKKLNALDVILPPLAEQQRIVAKLDAAFAEIDRAVERVNQQLLESEALYKTSLTRCFNDVSVTRKPMSEICKITSSKRVMKKDYVDNGVPFYRTKEIKQLANGKPVTTELFISKEMFDSLRHKYGAPREGEILITAIGTIGEVYIVREDDEFYFKDGNVLWVKEISEVSQEYLRYGLLSFVEQLNSLAHGAAYSALPIQRLKAFELPIPPIHQQLAIVKRLEESFELIATFKNSLSSKRKSLDILKSAILSQELQPPQSEAA